MHVVHHEVAVEDRARDLELQWPPDGQDALRLAWVVCQEGLVDVEGVLGERLRPCLRTVAWLQGGEDGSLIDEELEPVLVVLVELVHGHDHWEAFHMNH